MTLRSQPPGVIASKAGHFLAQAFQGPHRDKRIAQALGIHPNTAARLRKGYGWTPDQLDKLHAIGGAAMAEFIFGNPPAAPASNIIRLNQADQIFWTDDSGSIHHAAHGSAEFLRRALGDTGSDLSNLARRMMGWVTIIVRSDFTAEVRYTEGQANQTAMSRACSFLVDEGRKTLRTVKRVVDCAGEWIEAAPASPEETANALAQSARLGVAFLVVKQLNLDMARDHPEFRAIIEESTDATGAAWASALRHMPEQVSYAIVDGNLVTGQNPGSAKETAERVSALL